MSYYFFLDKIQLPIPPSKLDIRVKNRNKTITLINEGEVNILNDAGLSEINFKCLLPNSKYPFSQTFAGFQKVEYYLNNFENMKKQKKPFQFIVCRMQGFLNMLFNTNITVSLEEYNIEESATEGFDAIANVKLKQYRPYGTKLVNVTENADGTVTATEKNPRFTTKETPDFHKIAREQTLYEACKLQLGSADRYLEIATQNGITNPSEILKGRVIKF